MNDVRFGTAGAGDLFYSKGLKNSYDVPAFLAEMGLTAFEYQCGRGVRIGDEKAKLLGEHAKEHGIALSLHAPYFINMATDDEQKKENNLRYLRESAHAAQMMGATRIVFHPAGVGKGSSRIEAVHTTKEAMRTIIGTLNQEGYEDLIFCPETMGKMNQIGDLAETLDFCTLYENMLPCIDFGHLNSRLQGAVSGIVAYEDIFSQIANVLGAEKARVTHCHVSKIEYNRGGERKHLTFADTQFGPDYEPLVELLRKKDYTPTIICESAGTQAEDALAMSRWYKE